MLSLLAFNNKIFKLLVLLCLFAAFLRFYQKKLMKVDSKKNATGEEKNCCLCKLKNPYSSKLLVGVDTWWEAQAENECDASLCYKNELKPKSKCLDFKDKFPQQNLEYQMRLFQMPICCCELVNPEENTSPEYIWWMNNPNNINCDYTGCVEKKQYNYNNPECLDFAKKHAAE